MYTHTHTHMYVFCVRVCLIMVVEKHSLYMYILLKNHDFN